MAETSNLSDREPGRPPQSRRQRQRIGLGSTRGEDDVARLGTDRGGDTGPRLLDQPAGLAALGMHRGRQEVGLAAAAVVEVFAFALLLGRQKVPGRAVVGRLGDNSDGAGAPRRPEPRPAKAEIGDEVRVEALEGERAIV